MNEIKAVLFDMDGTLLPMDQKEFTGHYFGELCKAVVPTGYIEAEKLVQLIWLGTKAMVKNDGSKRNVDVFWECFKDASQLDEAKVREIEGMCDRFYNNEFHRAKQSCGENPLAVKAVEMAKRKGRKAVLASNPVFPRVGQLSRAGWVGLSENDFCLVTAYENQRFCKPNPKYYLDICENIGALPSECLMVGNDEREDAWAASQAGLRCFLVTDCLIPCEEHTWEGKRGSFAELVQYLSEL